MVAQVRITLRGLRQSEALEARIREKIAKLDAFNAARRQLEQHAGLKDHKTHGRRLSRERKSA